MSVPKKRRTKSSKNRRASHFSLKLQTLTPCAKCKKFIRPHTACPNCGTYRGRVVLKTKSDKRARKEKAAKRDKAVKGEDS